MYFTFISVWTLFNICSVYCRSIPSNSSVISEYANVAHWGTARSSQGQKLWTQRSNASISYGQNLRRQQSYDSSDIPAIGEIQERFNPKPYFAYGSASELADKAPGRPVNIASDNLKSPVYLPTPSPPEALPVPVLPTQEAKPHEDPYLSQYTSYNPPPKIENSSVLQPVDVGAKTTYSFDSPPEQYYGDVSFNNMEEMKTGPANYYHNQKHPDENVHDPRDVILDSPPPGYEDDDHKTKTGPVSDHQIPYYLYDDEHHSHLETYHDVEKPIEQKRVSKPQYSYYYIGRKLWYIPLYFSVYFIIYVTFLILKSIARHKIQFKHDFVDHHSRESRQLSSKDYLDNLHRNVSLAFEKGTKRYPSIAM